MDDEAILARLDSEPDGFAGFCSVVYWRPGALREAESVARLLSVPRTVLLVRGERTPGAAFETEARHGRGRSQTLRRQAFAPGGGAVGRPGGTPDQERRCPDP